MTDDEIMAAALSDPDAQPLTAAQLKRFKRMSKPGGEAPPYSIDDIADGGGE